MLFSHYFPQPIENSPPLCLQNFPQTYCNPMVGSSKPYS